ncbi:MAG: divalent-cation tolerance protein CutA [Candidatus Zixiibacteriota bacterium]
MADSDYVVVFATCDSLAEADRIAERLVTEKLAACVNINDRVTSIYEWKGKIQRDVEAFIIIKTKRSLVDQVQTAVKSESSYDCPEIIALPIVAGSSDYLKWLGDVTQG